MKRRYFYILILVFLIITGLFFGLYEMEFLYCEENSADKIANYISLPVLILLGFLFLLSEKVSFRRAQRFGENKYFKQVFATILTIFIAHFAFLRPVISGIVLFINVNFGIQSVVKIDGTVIGKYEHSGKGAEFELTIKDIDKRTFVFDTFGTETKRFNIGYKFEKNMIKGCLGLLYIKN